MPRSQVAKGGSARAGAHRRVVGLGLCVRDEVYLVDDFALDRSRTRYRARARMPGGMVTTALAHAAALGCESHLLSLVGDDPDGRAVASELRRLGVSTRRLARDPNRPTTTALVLVQRRTGQRRFVVPDRRALERGAPDFDLAPIRNGAILMIDGHFPAQGLRAARRARECGVPVIADLADARPAYRRLLPFVDYPIVPREFVAALGAGDVRETLRHLQAVSGGTPVVTLGAKGALALHAGRFHRIAAPRVAVVDTTGAGDAFHGAFAAGLAKGDGVLAALAGAARRASESCRHLGGIGALMPE